MIKQKTQRNRGIALHIYDRKISNSPPTFAQPLDEIPLESMGIPLTVNYCKNRYNKFNVNQKISIVSIEKFLRKPSS